MKAILGDTVIAEAPESELISIEGNWYFPPASVRSDLLVSSSTPYTCPWKGACQYFSVKDPSAEGRMLQDQAWSYPSPIASSFTRVGQDYTDYVAFWKNIKVVD
ncbi:MAG TPA: DUF427 domain-containing protein [Microbacteriaceae bacterium]